ncbi:MAG: polyprenol monophosphomannose synthase [Planctomycetaceae bacterium]|jgi:dolichol-phosphate mannosyltransferase|nr:polyprenol monophosphomannose synthase [Planctomycetaceae bacterium]
MKRILIALATYNERDNLPPLIDEIFAAVPEADILVIDDNSPDGTGDWAQSFSSSGRRLKLIRRSGKLGLGSAVLEAMRYAADSGYDYLLNMDADGSHRPQYIASLLQKSAEGYDVVIGSRYIAGGGVENWAWYRRLMSWCINRYARLMLGLKTRDNSGSFRCYRVELLRRLDTESVVSRGYSFFEEILYRLSALGASFAEVPIIFADRRFGQSKINKSEVFKALWILFRIAPYWTKTR